MKKIFVAAGLALALGACTTSNSGGRPNWATAGMTTATPSVMINASPGIVQSVVMSRAAARGSIIKPANGALVLERPIDQITPEITAACGDSLFGRKVRVVLRATPTSGGTQLTEERYIVGLGVGGDCRMPLSAEDVAQAQNALNAVKVQAEAGRPMAAAQ